MNRSKNKQRASDLRRCEHFSVSEIDHVIQSRFQKFWLLRRSFSERPHAVLKYAAMDGTAESTELFP